MKKQKLTDQPTIQKKRRRGALPGNKNAKGNRGNRSARGKPGNCGGCGAPTGNQYARKRRTLASELVRDYRQSAEALAWLKANEVLLCEDEIRSDTVLDQAMFLGLPLRE